MIKIISTTNRKGSLTEKVAEHYYTKVKKLSSDVEIVKFLDLPKDAIQSVLYENNGKNLAFNKIIKKVAEAEHIFFIIPEYNGSFPGVLKVFLDGLGWPSELEGKKCALTGVSDGPLGCILGLSHITDILFHIKANVFFAKVYISGIKDANIQILKDSTKYNKLIDQQIEMFLKW